MWRVYHELISRSLKMRVSPELLNVFVACVDCGSFSAAAKKLHKSQSTVSMSVSALEDDLNIVLFERQGRTVKLTKEGEVIYSRALVVLNARQELLNVAGELVDVHEVAITIALSGFIPDRQREYLKKQLDSHINSLQITILSAESYKIDSMISNGEVDIAVIPAINSRMNYPIEFKSRRTWFKSRLHLYCSQDHPLSQLSEISEDDIKNYRRIRLVSGMINNQSPRNNIYTDNIVSAYRLCAQGLGWCELPEWFVENQHRQGDTRLKKLAVSPIWQTLEFDAIFRNTSKGKFMDWFISVVTGKEPVNV